MKPTHHQDTNNERDLARLLRQIADMVERSTLLPKKDWITISEIPMPEGAKVFHVAADFTLRDKL